MSKKTAETKTKTKRAAKSVPTATKRGRKPRETRSLATRETVVVPLLVAIPKDAAKTVGAGLVVEAPEVAKSIGTVTPFTADNHPMRRASDKLNANDSRSARASRVRRDESAPAETTEPAAERTTSGIRGRVAGRYVAAKKTPAKMSVYTNSIKQVHQFVLRHKRGVAMKNISEKLEMPLGTVGWALRWLMKQGAVNYESAGAVAAAA